MRQPPFDKVPVPQPQPVIQVPAPVVVANQPVQAAPPAKVVDNEIVIPDRSTTTKGLMLPEDLAAETAMSGRAAALESRATNLEGRATALESASTGYGSRIAAVEGKATALEGLRALTLLNQSFTAPVLAVNASSSTNYAVPGARLGMRVVVTPRVATNLFPQMYARVSANDTVTVTIVGIVAVLTASTFAIDIEARP